MSFEWFFYVDGLISIELSCLVLPFRETGMPDCRAWPLSRHCICDESGCWIEARSRLGRARG